MVKKENTPMREIRRRYEENHKEERKLTNGQFNTYIPRKDLDEMNEFFAKYNLTKVQIVYAGYEFFKEQIEKEKKNLKNIK